MFDSRIDWDFIFLRPDYVKKHFHSFQKRDIAVHNTTRNSQMCCCVEERPSPGWPFHRRGLIFRGWLETSALQSDVINRAAVFMPAGAQEVSGATSAPATADPRGSLKDSLGDMVPCRADISLY